MTPQSMLMRMSDLSAEAMATCREKAMSRGVANLEAQGMAGVVGRIVHDKCERLRGALDALLHDNTAQAVGCKHRVAEKVDWAGVRDDLVDISNYALIAICLMEEENRDPGRHG